MHFARLAIVLVPVAVLLAGNASVARAGAPVGYHQVAKRYALDVHALGVPRAGVDGTIEVVITADSANGYHIDEDYPFMFGAPVSPGDVTYSQPSIVFRKRRANPNFIFERCKKGPPLPCALHILVPTTPSRSGSVTYGGSVYLCLCDSKQKCFYVASQKFSFDVDVK